MCYHLSICIPVTSFRLKTVLPFDPRYILEQNLALDRGW